MATPPERRPAMPPQLEHAAPLADTLDAIDRACAEATHEIEVRPGSDPLEVSAVVRFRRRSVRVAAVPGSTLLEWSDLAGGRAGEGRGRIQANDPRSAAVRILALIAWQAPS